MAVDATETWIESNGLILEDLRLLVDEDKEEKMKKEIGNKQDPANQDSMTAFVVHPNNDDRVYTIHDLEQLLHSASHLVTDFPTLR